MSAPSRTPAPLSQNRNFILLIGAQLVGGMGMWMLRLSQNWLILTLTESPAAVGTVVALQFLPLLILGPYGGLIADRHNKRNLVIGAQTVGTVLAALLAVITLTGHMSVAVLYVFAVLSGLVTIIDQPARQVLVTEIVGEGQLKEAVSTSNALNQLSGLFGPALAGLLIGWVGMGWTFASNAALTAVVVLLCVCIRRSELVEITRPARARGQLVEGAKYVWRSSQLRYVIALAGVMGIFGLNGAVIYASFADFVWSSGSTGFGWYNSAAAIGGLAGALLAARQVRVRPRNIFLGALAFAIAESLTAVSPEHWIFLLCVTATGVATMFFLTSAATFAQLEAKPHLRGRVMAIYSPLLLGGHALGGLFQGNLTEFLGVQAALLITGSCAATVTGVLALFLRSALTTTKA